MGIFLWVLQVLLALHTLMGAVWKFSHDAATTMPSLKAIPGSVWMGLSVLEIVCSICLLLPAVYSPAACLAPLAALFITAEMLLFCGVHLGAGNTAFGPMAYWLVVAALSAFIAYSRF